MIISVASGKGGTGKTTFAVNLALALGREAQYVDCDVEEPNGHLFLKPEIEKRLSGFLYCPVIDNDKCTHCGICQETCQFNALVDFPNKILFLKELCHGCGACTLACPENAISEEPREIGVIEIGRSGEVAFAHGLINVGEAMASPLIRQLKKHIDPDKEVIIDAPPGTSCPVIESVEGSDIVILVTEPTPFGLHDLKLAVEVVEALSIPASVIVNRADLGEVEETRNFCAKKRIPVILEIPFDRKIAEAYSRGDNLVDSIEGYRARLLEAYEKIRVIVSEAQVRNSANMANQTY